MKSMKQIVAKSACLFSEGAIQCGHQISSLAVVQRLVFKIWRQRMLFTFTHYY